MLSKKNLNTTEIKKWFKIISKIKDVTKYFIPRGMDNSGLNTLIQLAIQTKKGWEKMNANSNEQAVVNARREINELKNNYMDSLQNLVLEKNSKLDKSLEIILECQRKGNNYFNYVENFVGDSGLLGAHDNGYWITGFAEDCYAILESAVKHYQFLRSYAKELNKLDVKYVEPSINAYANMQRLVKEYLSEEKSDQLKKLFISNKLPFGGFDMPAAENSNIIATWQKILGIVLGVVLLIVSIIFAFMFSNLTIFQQFILRGTFAISLSLIATVVPGFINLTSRIRMKGSYFVIVAGGAIAIFVLIWLLNPPSL